MIKLQFSKDTYDYEIVKEVAKALYDREAAKGNPNAIFYQQSFELEGDGTSMYHREESANERRKRIIEAARKNGVEVEVELRHDD